MNVEEIVRELNEEIARLQAAVRALKGVDSGSSGAASSPAVKTGRRARRRMSADARAMIAAAQRKRWAKLKSGSKK
jgi:hypothetical protein